jgi:hypothetical protein
MGFVQEKARTMGNKKERKKKERKSKETLFGHL